MEWLDKILQSPAFTWITSVLIVCVFAFAIFKKTSWGKKAITTILGSFSRLEGAVGDFQAKSDKNIAELKNTLENYENAIDEKIAEFDKRNDELRKLVLLVCENTNNIHIKEYANLYLEKTDLDISELKEQYKNELIDKINELKGVVENGEEE